MGLFDKVLDVMRLNDDEYYDDDEYYEEDELEEPARKRFFFKKTGTDDIEQEPITVSSGSAKSRGVSRPAGNSASTSSNITPMRNHRSAKTMEVCVIKPTSFEDSREISETLLANRMVILNMEGMDTGTAQRIIDFVSGSCYAIDGELQQISNCIFLVTPHSVGVSGDLQELQGLMDTFNFSNFRSAI